MSNALRNALTMGDAKPIRYFGGRGNGVFEDTAAFIAAIEWANSLPANRAAHIDLHNGTFVITAALPQMTRPVVWSGKGRTQSRILFVNCSGFSYNLDSFDWSFHYSGLQHLTVITDSAATAGHTGFYHKGNVGPTGGHDLSLVMEHVSFTHSFSHNIATGSATAEWLQAIFIEDTDYALFNDLFVRGSSDNNVYALRTTSRGIRVHNCTGFQLKDSQIWNLGTYAARLTGQSEGSIIDGVTIVATDTGLLYDELANPANNHIITGTHTGCYTYGMRFAQNANPNNDALACTIENTFNLERSVSTPGEKPQYTAIEFFGREAMGFSCNSVRCNGANTTTRIGLRTRPSDNTYVATAFYGFNQPVQVVNVDGGFGHMNGVRIINSGSQLAFGDTAYMTYDGLSTGESSEHKAASNAWSIKDMSGNDSFSIAQERIIFGGRESATRTLELRSFVGGAAQYDSRLLSSGGHASTPGQATLQYDALAHIFNGDTVLSLDAPTNISSAGYRGLNPSTRNANYTLALVDAGRAQFKSDTSAYTWTIPPQASVVWFAGTKITLVNDGTAGNITLARGSGVALLNSANADANRTIGPGQTAVITRAIATDRWRITGEYS